MDAINIVLRPYDKDHDIAFIYSAWRNQAFYSALNKPEERPSVFFTNKTEEIKRILGHATIKIACLQDSPVTIVGYSVYTGNHLDWIYVKEDYRKQGVGTLLMPKNIETVPSELTKIGKVLADKKKLVTKGEKYGRIENKEPKETNPGLH